MGHLLHKLIELGLIYEMRDWKQHFIQGTKGMPKTEAPILNYVEGILKQAFENNTEKVNNNPLAPWLVITIKEIGPANINTATLRKIQNIVEYFKKTGNANTFSVTRNPDGTYKKMDIDSANAYAIEKLDKIKKKEALQKNPAQPTGENPENNKEEETQEEISNRVPLLQDEKDGGVQRVWVTNDGTGRIWVKVLKNEWLKKECSGEHAVGRFWGIGCQEDSDMYTSGKHENYQFLGPSKNDIGGGYSTIMALAVNKSTSKIEEMKQEGNHQPGSQVTSGGWKDSAEQVINFISFSPIMKETTNGIENHSSGSLALNYIGLHKPELINFLANNRPDILANNEYMFVSIMGKAWLEERNMNINEIAKTSPATFLLKFEIFFKRFGKEASDLLNTINLEAIAQADPNIIYQTLGSIVGNIPLDRFNNLIKNVDFGKYIINNTDAFKLLIKNMASLNEPEYKNMFKDLIYNHSTDIIQAFGNNGGAVYKFLNFASSPKLRQHQDIIKDKETGEYIGERQKVLRTAAGERYTITEKFPIPDQLRILTQKERRDFIVKNEDYIKSLIKTDQTGKEINYLKYLFSESNPQDIERTLLKEKDEFINYFDKKFESGQKDVRKLPNGKTVEIGYRPGIFEYYIALNKKTPFYAHASDVGNASTYLGRGTYGRPQETNEVIYYYPLKPADAYKYIKTIMKYYYGLRKKFATATPDAGGISNYTPGLQQVYQDQKSNKELETRYLAIKDFCNILKISGESPEKIASFYVANFAPEKIGANPKDALGLFISNLTTLLDKHTAWKTLESLRDYVLKFGAKATYENALQSVMEDKFLVKTGDMVEFIGYEGNSKQTQKEYGSIYLRYSGNYKVLDVRETSSAINAEILLMEDRNVMPPDEHPTEKWFPTYLFNVKKVRLYPESKPENKNEELNESIVRKLIRKRIKMISEKNIKRVSYTGIVLDNRSKDKLFEFINMMKKSKKIIIPDDWTFSADHVTINMGKAIDETLLGQKINMKVLSFSYDENTIAVGIKADGDIEFDKEVPHITIAYNELGGARPVMSNNLSKWKPVSKSFIIGGIVQEVLQEV